jgi:hypothetical protein
MPFILLCMPTPSMARLHHVFISIERPKPSQPSLTAS